MSADASGVPIQYNFTSIAEVARYIAQSQGDLAGLKEQIHTNAATLQAVWAANSGEAWSTVQAKWEKACAELETALQHLSSATGAAGTDMRAKEDQFTAMWQS